MQRVMCVWCPLWPVQRLRLEVSATAQHASCPAVDAGAVPARAVVDGGLDLPETSSLSQSAQSDCWGTPWRKSSNPPRPVILFEEGRRGLQVVVCSPEARRWRVRMGMSLGEVQSLLPATARGLSPERIRRAKSEILPLLRRANPVADRLKLQELALHCNQYSPLVGIEDAATPESLWLDLGGSEALYGGEQGLAETIQADLRQQGIQVRVGVADSWGGAWGISHFGENEISLIPPKEQAEWLSPLPIGALRISETIQQALQALDMTTVGQLFRLPRSSLPSRFGHELIQRMDQALGQVPELLIAERQAEPLLTEWLFDEPISDRRTLDHVCEVLLERLLDRLTERRAGLRELACHWLGTTTEPTVLRLLRPVNEKRHLLELLRLQNERRIFLSSVTGIRMEAVEIALAPVRQARLFDDDTAEKHPRLLAELIDRLSTRLGTQRVLRPRLMPDPQPEYACESVPWRDEKPAHGSTVNPARLRCRPLRLFQSPQPLFIEQASPQGLPTRIHHSQVVQLCGPERIETGWWRGHDAKRDYFRLDLANGAALWVFVDRDTGHWFLHGLFV